MISKSLNIAISRAIKILLLVVAAGCTRTPKYTDPNSITEIKEISVNGDNQYLLIRGKDSNKPIVLFLHGGPGMPMMYMAKKLKPLEEEFVVVQWDQRNSGKSFKKNLDKHTITVSNYLQDSYEVIDYLRERFNQDKIYLAGHSWGSYLGILLINERPELFHAYVGIGQVVNEEKAAEKQYNYALEQAQFNNDHKGVSRLRENRGWTEKYLFKYGGELKNHRTFWPFIWAGLFSREYTLGDVGKVPKGSQSSSKLMQFDVIQGGLVENDITKFEIPVYFFTGVQDYTTPFKMIEEYFENITAPNKKMVWFSESAHFPFFEEPDVFCDEMIKVKTETLLKK